MKNKNVFLGIILYFLFGWFACVTISETMNYFPYLTISVLHAFFAYMFIMASGQYAIFGIITIEKPNEATRSLKFTASLFVFGLTLFLLILTGWYFIWVLVLSLVVLVLFLFLLAKAEEKFWNPIFSIEKKVLVFMIRHEKDASRASCYKEKYRNLIGQRMMALASPIEQFKLYMRIEILALKLRKKMIEREMRTLSLSHKLQAMEAADLEKSTKM